MANLSLVEKDINAIVAAGGTDQDVENYLKSANIAYQSPKEKHPSLGLTTLSEQRSPEKLGGAITAAEILGGFTPASPVIMGAGEFARSLAKGEKYSEEELSQKQPHPSLGMTSLKEQPFPEILRKPIAKGAAAAALDLALMKGGGLVSKAASKATSKMAGKLGGQQVAKAVSYTSGIPEEHITKAWSDPKKYLSKPLSAKEELAQITKVKDMAVNEFDNVFNFRTKTIEDSVAKTVTKYPDSKISVEPIEKAIKNYIDEVIDEGMIDTMPKPVERLLVKLRNKSRPIYVEMGRQSPQRYLAFEDAHKFKQKIYKMVGESYGAENFTDTVSNAFKKGAHAINDNLRNVPIYGEKYAKANDSVKVIYDLYDEIGTTGEKIFKKGGIQKGASKWFKNMFNDPEGRLLLNEIEKVLPTKNQGFMSILDGIEETQIIKKGFQEPRTGFQNLPFVSGGTAGGGAYLATRNVPLALAAGIGGGVISSPRMLRSAILAKEGAKGFGMEAAKLATPPLRKLLITDLLGRQ